MHCRAGRLPGGTPFIACGERAPRPRCQEAGCHGKAEAECDFKLGDGKTCDARLCSLCRNRVGPDKDLCSEHFTGPRVKAYLERKTDDERKKIP